MLTESGPTDSDGRDGSSPKARPSQPVEYAFEVGAPAGEANSSTSTVPGITAARIARGRASFTPIISLEIPIYAPPS